MKVFDRNPRLFQIAFGLLTAFLAVIGALTIYSFASGATDENLYRNPPSNLYITEAAPGYPDSMRVGDLLLSISGIRVKHVPDLSAAISSVHADTILLNVLRPSESQELSYSVGKGVINAQSVRELPPTAYVFDVTEDGASDRAGLKVGDLILRVNGQTFRNTFEADSIMRRGQIGKALEYTVLRENKEVSLNVTLAALGFPFSFLAFIAAGVAFVGFGAFVALKRPQLKTARLLGTAFVLLGFPLLAVTPGRGIEFGLVAAVRLFAIGTAFSFGIAFLWHSRLYFPKERPELLRKPWTYRAVYILAAIIFLRSVVRAPAAVDIAILVVTAAYFIIVKLVFRKQASAEYKKLSKIMNVTAVAVVTASTLLLVVLLVVGKSDVTRAGYIGLFLIAFPASYLYTIARYRLLDIHLRVRRSTQYSFASFAWGVASLALLAWVLWLLPSIHLPLPHIRLTGGSLEVLDAPLKAEQQGAAEKVVLMVSAVALAFLFRKVGRDGQDFLARKFHRAKYDYRRAGSELAEVMSTRLNMSDLARGIVEKLVQLMRLKRAGVFFFRQQKTCCCSEALGFDRYQWTEFCLSLPQDLGAILSPFKGEIAIQSLPEELRAPFQQHGFQLVIPVRSKEKLVGALMLGEKLSESPFTRDDYDFLSAAAGQASVAIENAFLYEELAGQERLKRELEIARKIQLDSLPRDTPSIEGLDIAGSSSPATEVGGDYFDYLVGPDQTLTVIVGDVSGKGTAAALYMSKIQGIMRSLHGFRLSPKDLFVRVNALLWNDLERKSFVTALGAFFHARTRRVVVARAGHLPLFLLRRRDGEVERILPKGIGFGLTSKQLFGEELEEMALRYESGDTFLFVTDGITEAHNSKGEQFGEENLAALLTETADASAAEIRDFVLESVRRFAGDTSQHDDQTVVVVKAP